MSRNHEKPPLDEVLTDAREAIERDIAGGFATPDEILESTLECFSDDVPAEALRPHAEPLLREGLEVAAAQGGEQVAAQDVDQPVAHRGSG